MKALNFQSHAKSIIKTSNQKLRVIIRVAPVMTKFNKNFIFSSLIKGKFNSLILDV